MAQTRGILGDRPVLVRYARPHVLSFDSLRIGAESWSGLVPNVSIPQIADKMSELYGQKSSQKSVWISLSLIEIHLYYSRSILCLTRSNFFLLDKFSSFRQWSLKINVRMRILLPGPIHRETLLFEHAFHVWGFHVEIFIQLWETCPHR